MKLTFCGAAKIVTGSCYLLETKKDRILIDCGMFQGSKDITRRNYENFPFDPKSINVMLLTHAHIDHSGLIPKLKKAGFSGYIYATPATIDLVKVMLEDSGHIQETETMMENKRRNREGLPSREPLYTMAEALDTFKLFKEAEYERFINVTKNIRVRYRDAGHILGSASIEVYAKEEGVEKKIVFSGDLGQWDAPIIKDPTLIGDADYVLVESTYGDTLHESTATRDQLLLQYTMETFRKGGKLLIPCFAVERTQELLYTFNTIIKRGQFPDEQVFLDSPLAIKATDVFRKHRECFDINALRDFKDPFDFTQLVKTLKAEDSMKINTSNKPCVVIAGDGMCTAGRIRHHFKHGIWDPKNTVCFVGYQAEGTLGRYIMNGAKKIRMMGMEIVVQADIRRISSFSAHGDYEDIIKWMKGFTKKPAKVFVVHGEPEPAAALRKKLYDEGFNPYVPDMLENVELK